MQAHWLVSVLESHGITARVVGEMLFGTRGETGLGPSNLPEIHVEEADLPRAARLIDDAIRGRAAGDEEKTPPWTCPLCSEEVEGQFSACWSCGATRPAG